MKTIARATLAAVVVAFLGVAIARVQAPDLLPPGWERSDPPGSTSLYSFQVDGAIKRSGLSSVRIQSREGSTDVYTILRQRFLAEAFRGRRVRLAGYLRVADVARWVGLRMQITGSATHRANDNMKDRSLQGTGDWQRCEIVLDVPGDATLVEVGAILTGRGTLWADDFEFGVVGDEVPTTGGLYPPVVETLEPDLPRAPRNLGCEGEPAAAPPPSPPPSTPFAAPRHDSDPRWRRALRRDRGAPESARAASDSPRTHAVRGRATKRPEADPRRVYLRVPGHPRPQQIAGRIRHEPAREGSA